MPRDENSSQPKWMCFMLRHKPQIFRNNSELNLISSYWADHIYAWWPNFDCGWLTMVHWLWQSHRNQHAHWFLKHCYENGGLGQDLPSSTVITRPPPADLIPVERTVAVCRGGALKATCCSHTCVYKYTCSQAPRPKTGQVWLYTHISHAYSAVPFV